MEFLEPLTGEYNRFDRGFPLSSKETKALRDAVIYLYDKVEKLEARFTPSAEPDAVEEEPHKPKNSKKNG